MRDAWVHHDMARAEAKGQIERVADEIDLVPLSPATLRRLLAHMLSLNAAGTPPPFGTLDAVEALGLGVVNPEVLSPEDVVGAALGDPDGGLDESDVLAEAASWPARYGFMGSWFEDDAAVDEVLTGRKGASRARKVDLVLEGVVAPRRRRWGEMLAWMALITADADAREEATRFALAAAALLGDRPPASVPLLRAIAEGTVEARRLRRA